MHIWVAYLGRYNWFSSYSEEFIQEFIIAVGAIKRLTKRYYKPHANLTIHTWYALKIVKTNTNTCMFRILDTSKSIKYLDIMEHILPWIHKSQYINMHKLIITLHAEKHSNSNDFSGEIADFNTCDIWSQAYDRYWSYHSQIAGMGK